jgi:hypothetical protein
MKLVKFLFFKASHCGRTTRTNRARQPKPSRFVPKPHKFLVEPLTSRVLLSVAFMHPAMGGMARGLLLRLKTTELFCQPLPVPQPCADVPRSGRAWLAMAWPRRSCSSRQHAGLARPGDGSHTARAPAERFKGDAEKKA